ncbi:MAG TPA: fructosamine kinase family protein [Streptosporangiaceae bacterium]|nr:fructosamine kinase family protein [Streptosporangiaceae bacterium]
MAHYRLELADGRAAFAKVAGDAFAGAGPPDPELAGAGTAGPRAADPRAAGSGLAAEASGLRWLGAATAVPVPEVLAGDDHALVISWIAAGAADRRSAIRFGRELALLHAAGSAGFGAPWPGVIAGLPLPNGPGPAAGAGAGGTDSGSADSGSADSGGADSGGADSGGADSGGLSWAEWYAGARLLPYVRLGRDRGALGAGDAAVVEAAAARVAEVAGPAEPPSRIHGDCWSGNVLWSGGRGWLIDPAAHGGHRESDLAMLSLFGAPHLREILAAYQEAAPLAVGWAARVPLHQLHPLLVHVCLFGDAYTASAVAAARAVLVM